VPGAIGSDSGRRLGVDLVGDELGVVFDPPEQRGSPRVLPGETEDVEAAHVGDPAPVKQLSVVVGNGKLDPGVVEAVARRPDDRVDVKRALVG
jgi:hypothetical protein